LADFATFSEAMDFSAKVEHLNPNSLAAVIIKEKLNKTQVFMND